MNKTCILIQARLSSSRFPKKMLEPIGEITLCEYVYNRCITSKKSDFVAVITSEESSDDELVNLCNTKNIPIFRGSLNNVLDRYIKAADNFGANKVVRVCGDSPFVDIEYLDQLIEFHTKNSLDYCTITDCLNGFKSEIIQIGTLKMILSQNDLSLEDIEHVTKYIIDRLHIFKYKFLSSNLKPNHLANHTLTVDFPSDIEIARFVANGFADFSYSSNDVLLRLEQFKK